jgi:hypothetical protein
VQPPSSHPDSIIFLASMFAGKISKIYHIPVQTFVFYDEGADF